MRFLPPELAQVVGGLPDGVAVLAGHLADPGGEADGGEPVRGRGQREGETPSLSAAPSRPSPRDRGGASSGAGPGTSHGRRRRRRACDLAAFRQIAASHARVFSPRQSRTPRRPAGRSPAPGPRDLAPPRPPAAPPATPRPGEGSWRPGTRDGQHPTALHIQIRRPEPVLDCTTAADLALRAACARSLPPLTRHVSRLHHRRHPTLPLTANRPGRPACARLVAAVAAGKPDTDCLPADPITAPRLIPARRTGVRDEQDPASEQAAVNVR
jgi:hypothetical protein